MNTTNQNQGINSNFPIALKKTYNDAEWLVISMSEGLLDSIENFWLKIPVERTLLLSPCRKKELVWIRCIGYRIYLRNQYTFERVAFMFGRTNHATVFHSVNRAFNTYIHIPEFRELYEKLDPADPQIQSNLRNNKPYKSIKK